MDSMRKRSRKSPRPTQRPVRKVSAFRDLRGISKSILSEAGAEPDSNTMEDGIAESLVDEMKDSGSLPDKSLELTSRDEMASLASFPAISVQADSPAVRRIA